MARDIDVQVFNFGGTTLLGTLQYPSNIAFRLQHGEVGRGNFSVPLTVPNPANETGPYIINPDLALLDDDNLAVFRIGATNWGGFIVGQFNQTRISERGGSADKERNYSGDGLLSILGRAVLRPYGGVGLITCEDRAFGWMAPEYVDTAWTNAVQIKKQGDLAAAPLTTEQWDMAPKNWLDPDAYWIWAVAQGAAGPTIPPQFVGDTYYRTTFSIATQRTVAIQIAADDGYELWLDDCWIAGNTEAYAWQEMTEYRILLDPGTHYIAIKGTNIDRPDSVSTNVAGVLFSMMNLTADGDPDPASVIVRSNSSWKAHTYSYDPPGMTAGHIMNIVIAEAQLDNAISSITQSYTASMDSNAASWDQLLNQVWPVGTKLLDVLRTLIEIAVDARMPPSLVLAMTNKDELGTDKSATIVLTEGTHFNSLEHDHAPAEANVAMMRFQAGAFELEDDAASATLFNRKEIFLSVPTAPNDVQARRAAQALFRDYGRPAEEVTFAVERYDSNGVLLPATQPLTHWRESDIISVPDLDGIQADTLIMALTFTMDETGKLIVAVEGTQGDVGGS